LSLLYLAVLGKPIHLKELEYIPALYAGTNHIILIVYFEIS